MRRSSKGLSPLLFRRRRQKVRLFAFLDQRIVSSIGIAPPHHKYNVAESNGESLAAKSHMSVYETYDVERYTFRRGDRVELNDSLCARMHLCGQVIQ